MRCLRSVILVKCILYQLLIDYSVCHSTINTDCGNHPSPQRVTLSLPSWFHPCVFPHQPLFDWTALLPPGTSTSSCLPSFLDCSDLRLVNQSVYSLDYHCFYDGPLTVKYRLGISCDNPAKDTIFDVLASIQHPKFLQIEAAAPKKKRALGSGFASDGIKFDQDIYEANVTEEQEPPIRVVTVQANNIDRLPLFYNILAAQDARSMQMFKIDRVTGDINAVVRLDRELIAKHVLRINAYEAGSPSRAAVASVIINVIDTNDHRPHFEKSVYVASISEAADIGTTVLHVHAKDDDDGMNGEVTYTLENEETSTNRGQFAIDPKTGVLKTRRFLDREKQDFYRLKVNACDRSPSPAPLCSTALIEISINDENDFNPQFDKSKYLVEIKEDTDPILKPVIAKISAIDQDAGENGKLHYSIFSGNTANKFAIDYDTGEVRLLGKLNYKETSQYELVVRAQDGGRLPISNTTLLIISILDVNDHTPVFYHPSTSAVIREDASIGAFVTNVQAYDGDSGQNAAIRYSLLLDPIDEAKADFPFELNESTGTITVKSNLDREAVPMYDFHVVATDGGHPPLSSSVRVLVHVSDINDNNPQFERKIYNRSIPENTIHGAQILRLSAFDPDEASSRLDYSISAGNEEKKFLMVNQGDSAQLTINGKLDYKQRSIYSLSIKATDSGGQHDTATVYVYVEDVNSAPFFNEHPFVVRVYENEPLGSTVAVIQASDNDDGRFALLTYTMDGDHGYFRIDPQTGVIYVNGSIDRETHPSFDLRIIATDAGDPPLSATTQLEVVVDDVNDVTPKFQQQNYTTVISEDTPVGTSFFQVIANDADDGANGRLVYFIGKRPNEHIADDTFYIDASSGIIRVQKPLDREKISDYFLPVLAVDKGTPSLTGTCIVHISLSDINDNSPTVIGADSDGSLHFYVPENSPVGTKVAHLSASDPDVGINAKITYKIFGGPDMASFDLLSTTDGEGVDLLTRSRMDYESKKNVYQLQLQAISGDLSTVVDLYVHLLDTNDHRPQLNDFYVIFNNYEDQFPLNRPGRVPAHDPDVNDTLKYRIVRGNEAHLLHLDEKTGFLTLGANLNTNRQVDASMRICVSDGPNEACANCWLRAVFVTEDMLLNSVTVRVRGANAHAFLNPIPYNRFVDTLATLLPSNRDDVFIFSVVNDADVLNISFSIRRPGQGKFVSSGELQELIYLNQNVLKSASHLDILPFEDNLCVREPCLNFERCQNVLKFGEAPDFISTDTFLFRPVNPVNTFVCLCPEGFAGRNAQYMCDTEVNLCYSSPCGLNGTCVPKEGGYICICPPDSTGSHCEFPLDNEFCLPDVCRGGSQCHLSGGKLTCRNCPYPAEFTTSYCQLTARTFTKRSYITLAPIKARNRFQISLRFATIDQNGVLFYNGRYHPQGDFVALSLHNGRLNFDFSIGDDKVMRARFDDNMENLADGQWHSVVVSYNNRTVTISHDDCDEAIAFHQSAINIDYPRCAVRSTYELDEKCSNPTVSCFRFLDLTGPFYVGGLPRDDDRRQFRVKVENFDGCIKDLVIDGGEIDFNRVVSNFGAEIGCKALHKAACAHNPCKHGGHCRSVWGGYTCECGDQHGGQNCTDEVSPPRRLLNHESKILYELSNFPFPFAMGLSFRTRRHSFAALTADFTNHRKIAIKLIGSHFIVEYGSDRFDIPYHHSLSDGQWHTTAVSVAENHLNATIDYVYSKTFVLQESFYGGITKIFVGSEAVEGDAVKGTTCVKGVFFGRTLRHPQYLKIESEIHTDLACVVSPSCTSNPCTQNSICEEDWDSFSCRCPAGYVGGRGGCVDVCVLNPCANGGQCHKSADVYKCACPSGFSGRLCEVQQSLAGEHCPKNWWGYPFCAPCGCQVQRGYEADCDKKMGECKCKALHYLPDGSDRCLPCDCYYPTGASNATCDYHTGQCICRGNIIGRRCDSCADRSSQINRSLGRCQAIAGACPESFDEGILWPRTTYGITAYRPCPAGLIGTASRKCNSEIDLWSQSDLFNCTSLDFESLRRVLTKLDNDLELSPYLSKRIAAELRNATEERDDRLYGGDLYVSYRLLLSVLRRELNQPIEGSVPYSHIHDKRFVENIIHSSSIILSGHYSSWWREMSAPDGGREPIALLVQSLHDYGMLLTRNHVTDLTRPFRLRTENIFFSVDAVRKKRNTGFELPKYDSFVYDGNTDGFGARIAFPAANSGFDDYGFVFYASFGSVAKLMHTRPREEAKRSWISGMINTPVVSLAVFNASGFPIQQLSKQFIILFPWLNNQNRTNPQCVWWQHKENSGGSWQKSGCTRITANRTHVVCGCVHLSTFAVVVEESEGNSLDLDDSAHFWLANYVNMAITALSVLLLAIVSLHACCCRQNWFRRSNNQSILKSIVACFCLSEITFIFVSQAYASEAVCRAVGASLQFAYTSLFAWTMLYLLHLYRTVIEIKDVDLGISWIYSLLGWGLPLIPVGITALLSASSWRHDDVCWFAYADPYIWCMVGPIGLLILISLYIAGLCTMIGYSKEWRILTSKFNFRDQLASILIALCLIMCQWLLAVALVNWRVAFLYYCYHLSTLTVTAVLLYMIIRQNSHTLEADECPHVGRHQWLPCPCCRWERKLEEEHSSKIGRRYPTEDPSATVSRPDSPVQAFLLPRPLNDNGNPSVIRVNGRANDEDDQEETGRPAQISHNTPPLTSLHRPMPSTLPSSPAPRIRLNSTFNSPIGSFEDFSMAGGCHTPQSVVSDILTLRRPIKPDLIPSWETATAGGYATIRKPFANGHRSNNNAHTPILSPVQKVLSDSEEESPVMKRLQKPNRFQTFVSPVGYAIVSTNSDRDPRCADRECM